MPDVADETILAVAETVSRELEIPVTEVPSLTRSIDIEALTSLVANDPTGNLTVSFTHAGLQVIVHSNDSVIVRPTLEDCSQSAGPESVDRKS